jgi:acyl-CoA thioester hydrolase
MLRADPLSGRFEATRHLFAVRVYYEDTDLSGVVYHANYLRWFERARSDMLRLLGIDQRAAIEAGEGAYAVADMALRYVKPAKLDDTVTVITEVAAISPATCRLLQRAFRDGDLLCTAEVRVAFVAPNGRPRRQPPAWVEAFRAVAPTNLENKGPVPA